MPHIRPIIWVPVYVEHLVRIFLFVIVIIFFFCLIGCIFQNRRRRNGPRTASGRDGGDDDRNRRRGRHLNPYVPDHSSRIWKKDANGKWYSVKTEKKWWQW